MSFPTHRNLPYLEQNNGPVLGGKDKLIRNPPQLGIYELDLFHVSLGPSLVLHVRCYGPCFSFGCPGSGRLAAVHAASVPVCNNGVLVGRALAGFRMAPLARPTGPELRTTAGINEFFSVN